LEKDILASSSQIANLIIKSCCGHAVIILRITVLSSRHSIIQQVTFAEFERGDADTLGEVKSISHLTLGEDIKELNPDKGS
jgi:hypothetical protein